MSNLAGLARALRRERDWLGVVLVTLIAAHASVAIATGVSPDVARWAMRRFHLRSESFAAWASYQLGPWMYNFENQVLISQVPLTREHLDPRTAPYWFINHQPARVFTFADHRPILFAQPGEHFIYLRSRYREAHVLTGFQLRVYSEPGPFRASVTRMGRAQ